MHAAHGECKSELAMQLAKIKARAQASKQFSSQVDRRNAEKLRKQSSQRTIQDDATLATTAQPAAALQLSETLVSVAANVGVQVCAQYI